ncbi:MAG: ABC transporter ATP-binding protein [Rickettsiales bacterium]
MNNFSKVSKFIINSAKNIKSYIFGHLLVITISAFNVSLMPMVSKALLNIIIISKHDDVIKETFVYMLILSLLIILPSILSRVSDFLWAKSLPKFKHKITHDSIKQLLGQSHDFFQNNFSGAVVNKVRDLFNSSPKILEIFLYNFVGGSLAIIFATIILATINIYFALALILWVGIIIPISYRCALQTNRISMNVANQQSKIMGNIVDIFANIQNIRLFSNSKYELNRVDKFQNKYSNLYTKRAIFLNKNYTLLGLVSSSYFILCFVYLIWLYSRQKVTVGDFILIFGINNFLHNIIQDAMKQIRNFLEEYSVLKEAIYIIEQKNSIQSQKKYLVIKNGEIIFNKIKFSYETQSSFFADNSIKIEAGQKVGLVGHSGSGKSTFINLLLRFYDVESGEILIDGQNIKDVSLDSLHDAITLIPQEPVLFHRNLIENISYGNKENLSPQALLDKVIESAKNASAHSFINKMNNGYNSFVGERGVKLSGGQRQRIAIARAFFKNSSILILDEATSQLDSVTENMIQESLRKLMEQKTTLVIAHRLSTLQKMDRILVFNHGKIVEDGPHEELIALNGYYKRLWSAQVDGVLTYQIEFATAQPLFSVK